jgi:acetyl esterase/lipase
MLRLAFCLALVCWSAASLAPISTAIADDLPYTQTKNVVYAETDGIGLVMDIFTPTGPANGLAIVDVVSGAWHSDRGKIEQHRMAQMYDIFCSRGYTVFGVRPGSRTKFSLSEMAKHVKQGIAWVKDHAEEYKIDPNKLGLAGASAGGHLASLVAVTSDDKSKVEAVGVFFPPTNFLKFRGVEIDENSPPERFAMVKELIYPNGNAPTDTAKMIDALKAVSPALLATDKAPPFLLIHGDADPLVPLDQSEMLKKALDECGGSCQLIVKKGGAHPWPTIHEEVAVIADWFDKRLAGK